MKTKYSIRFAIASALLILFAGNKLNAQNIFPATGATGIGTTTPDASSILEMLSTTKGMLVPRMTLIQRNAIALPATGLMIYQTNSTPGFYYYSGTAWVAVSTKGPNKFLSNLTAPTAVNVDLLSGTDNSLNLGSANNSWKDLYLDGSLYLGGSRFLSYIAGTGTGNTVVGAAVLNANTTGINNTGVGFNALLSNTTGNYNTANGYQALQFNSIGGNNTATGYKALQNNTTGTDNVANGLYALINNTTGYSNVAIGVRALASNTVGHNLVAVGDSALFHQGINSGDFYMNTAIGSKALYSNTTGTRNTANGYEALYSNITGSSNTAVGYWSLFYNTTGSYNTANGEEALNRNISGSRNTATGYYALELNRTGSYNTADGFDALISDTSGIANTAVGYNSLFTNSNGNYNTAIGYNALTDNSTGILNMAGGYASLSNNTVGSDNTAYGNNSLTRNTTGSNNTAIGSSALLGNSAGAGNTAVGEFADVASGNLFNTTMIGYQAICGSSNQVRIGNSDITSIGGYKAWTNLSDGRVKKNIKANVPGLPFINLLKPITYNLDLDAADKIIQRPAIKDKDGKTIQPTQEQITSRQIQQQVICTGFIAQDVEASAKKIGYDFDGVDAAKNDKDLYGLRYSEFVVPLVKAVQELSKMNDDKDSAMNAMKENYDAKIDALQKQINELRLMMASDQSSVSSQQSTILSSTSLEQNIPNPFTNTTTIGYSLPQSRLGWTSAKIIITDKNGKQLKQMNLSGAGKGTIHIDASTLASGAYNYALYVDGRFIASKQMERLK